MARVTIVFCLLLAVVAAAPKKKKSAIKGRIVGGSEINISDAPFLVSIKFKNIPFCSASLIASEYLLTAAHCVELGSKSDYSVRGGSKYHAKEGETRELEEIKMHPGFSNYTAENDIAVLKLNKPFSKNSGVKTIKLAETEPKVGEEVVVSGWGGTKEGEFYTSNLLTVKLSVVSREECQKVYKDWNNITKDMFCAGVMSGGKDACQGDSGGAALLDGKLAGIVSWGLGCGRKDIAGVYTTVANFKKWIQEQIH